jgi:hypothetical protein
MKPDDARKKVNKIKNNLRMCLATKTKPDLHLVKQAADRIDELERELENCKIGLGIK